MFAGGFVDGRKGRVENGVEFFFVGDSIALAILCGGRNEFLSGKDVRVCDVADVCPVEEVGVVANLKVCLAVFEDLGKLGYRSDVSRSIPNKATQIFSKPSLEHSSTKLTQRYQQAEVQPCVGHPCR